MSSIMNQLRKDISKIRDWNDMKNVSKNPNAKEIRWVKKNETKRFEAGTCLKCGNYTFVSEPLTMLSTARNVFCKCKHFHYIYHSRITDITCMMENIDENDLIKYLNRLM